MVHLRNAGAKSAFGGVMYKKVDASLNFLDREQKVLDFWNENKVFEQSIKKNEGHPEFTFYDGPPTANGKPVRIPARFS